MLLRVFPHPRLRIGPVAAPVRLDTLVLPAGLGLYPFVIEVCFPLATCGTPDSPFVAGVAAGLRCREVVLSVATPICVLVPIKRIDVGRVVIRVHRIPRPRLATGVEQDQVVDAPVLPPPLLRVAVCAGSLPRDGCAEAVSAKHGIHQELEVVARSIVAVQVDTTCLLEHAMQLEQAHGHEDQVAHHRLAACLPGGLDHRIDGWASIG